MLFGRLKILRDTVTSTAGATQNFQDHIEDFDENASVESLNSDPITTIEFRVPGQLKGKFTYRTFRIDETTNDTGGNHNVRKVSDSAVFEDVRLREDPRFIDLTWSRVNKTLHSGLRESTGSQQRLWAPYLSNTSVKKNIEQGKYNDLRSFSNGNFFNLIIQDTGMDGKLFTAISASFEIEKEKELEELHEKTQRVDLEIQQKLKQKLSMLEQMRVLNESRNEVSDDGALNSSETVQQSQDAADKQIASILQGIVNEYGSDLEQDDYVALDKFSKEKQFLLADNFKNTPFDAVLNDKFLYTISKTVSSDNLGIFADEFQNFDETFKSIEKSRINEPGGTLNPSTNERVITSVDEVRSFGAPQTKRNQSDWARSPYTPVTTQMPNPTLRFIGYIIDKFYVDNDLNRVNYDSIAVPGNTRLSYRDKEIIYGVTYYYTVAQLAELLVPIVDPDSGSKKVARILIKGKPSNATLVKTVEKIPPQPPRDFFAYYNAKRKALHLSWSTAADSQKDVTKYLIFKRMTIDEPFKLIGLIDFTPKNYQIPELPKYKLDSSVEVTNEIMETTNFFDKEFTFNTTPIYAIVSGDAHELYSNYSVQLQVKFDLFRNVLNISKISDANAPLPYPNFYAKKSVFEKAIFTQKAKSIRLVFNPDILELEYIDEETSTQPKSVSVLAKELGETYKMSIINTDLGASQIIDIDIEDTIPMTVPASSLVRWTRGGR